MQGDAQSAMKLSKLVHHLSGLFKPSTLLEKLSRFAAVQLISGGSQLPTCRAVCG
jgi:hypothetical protein